MKQFFKFTLASFLGIFLFSILSFFLTLGIVAALASGSDEVGVEENSILKLNLNGAIVENASLESNPFSDLEMGLFAGESNIGLIQLLEAIDKASKDERVKGIYLDVSTPSSSYAQLFELRDALEKFKESGKFIYSYADVYTEKGYFVASVADEVYINPAGIMDFNGIAIRYVYYKKLFDKLGIEPIIFKVGKYKSAVESFSRANMSEENRKQSLELANSINDLVFEKIAKSRNIPFEKLMNIADSLLAFQPKNAEKLGLVKTFYQDQLDSLLKEKVSIEQDEDLKFISYRSYSKDKKSFQDYEGSDKIGVLVAEGDILGSKSSDGIIGSSDFNKELEKLVENKRVKAIVIRINSPGGSSLTTDIMWRAIKKAKVKKPIVISMSGYAASGGYYMAAAADEIIASPTTITGSIGIFSQWLGLDRFLEDKIGITSDQVLTNDNADFLVTLSNLPAYQKKVMQDNVEAGYKDFVSKVAEGRKMTFEEIDEIASGRVWTGQMALKIGLVDSLGYLKDAIAIAAKKAELEKDQYKILVYPKAKSPIEQILESSSENVSEKIIQNLGEEYYPYSKVLLEINKLNKRKGLMCRLPYDIEIE